MGKRIEGRSTEELAALFGQVVRDFYSVALTREIEDRVVERVLGMTTDAARAVAREEAQAEARRIIKGRIRVIFEDE